MPGIYKLFTSIVALIGNVSLISTGEMNPAFSFIGTGLLWGYYRSFKSLRTLPKWGVGSLSLTTFLVFLFDFYVSGDIFISVAQMTLVFQTIKSFDIKDSWDPPQVFFMSLLQLLIASELTSSLSFRPFRCAPRKRAISSALRKAIPAGWPSPVVQGTGLG